MSNENVVFYVVAGKYDEEGENVKYSKDFSTMEEVIGCIKKNELRSYPFCRVEKYVDGKMVASATV